MKSAIKVFGLISAVFLLGAAVCTAEEAAAPAMTPEQQAQMEKIKQNTTPGQAHKALEPLVGKWNYVSKFWMSADAKPDESTGTSVAEMIYGGRFLKETFTGTWMGQPFEGTGYTGYDNVKQEYVSIWIDGMGTGIMKTAGQYDAASKTFKFSGTNSCPMTGEKERAGRMEDTMPDSNHRTMAAYGAGPDGKEYKAMEITYTRA